MERPRYATIALLASVALSTACTHHSYHQEPTAPPVFFEREPNDESWQADFIGHIGPGSHLFVEGDVQAFGSDLYDGFAFVAEVPMVVSFYLEGHNHSADIDLAVYDPFIDEFVAHYDSPWNPEEGHFTILDAGQEFHLVIDTWLAGTSYTLELWGDALGHLPSSGELPSSAPQSAFDFGERAGALRSALSPEQQERRSRLQAYRAQDVAALEPQQQEQPWITVGQFFVIDPETLELQPVGTLSVQPGSD